MGHNVVIEFVAGPHVLKGIAAALEARVLSDGALTDATGTPTVTITREDGTVIVTSGATTKPSTGVYRYTLTPSQAAQVDKLTCVWAFVIGGATHSFTAKYLVLGDLLFTLQDARGFGDQALASAATYPDFTLVKARDRILEEFQLICQIPFGAQYDRVTLNGDDGDAGQANLGLPQLMATAIRSIETRAAGATTWTSFTAAELADVMLSDTGRMYRESLGVWPTGQRNVRVGYEYGYQPVPQAIRRAGLVLLRSAVVASDVSDRTMSFTDQLGTYRFSTAGERGAWFGIPEVDAVLDRYAANAGQVA